MQWSHEFQNRGFGIFFSMNETKDDGKGTKFPQHTSHHLQKRCSCKRQSTTPRCLTYRRFYSQHCIPELLAAPPRFQTYPFPPSDHNFPRPIRLITLTSRLLQTKTKNTMKFHIALFALFVLTLSHATLGQKDEDLELEFGRKASQKAKGRKLDEMEA